MRNDNLIALALLCGAALPAHAADSWTPQQPLSGPKDVYAGSSAAIDPRGDAVAVWVDQRSINGSGIPDRLLARTRVAGAALGPSSTVAVLDTIGNIYDPRVYMTEAGFATALWLDGNHIRYNDHPLGGHWTATRNVTPNSPGSNGFYSAYAIAADHVGDLAVRVNDEVFVRPKGGQFRSVGSPLDPVKYPNIQPDGDLLIGPSGDVAAFQTTYDVVCSPPRSHHCRKINLKVRLSRLRPGSATWQVAGDNDLATGDAYVLDDQGRLVFATQTGSGVIIATQPKFGAPATTITTIATTATVGGLGADATGAATVLLNDAAAKQTVAFVGPLRGGAAWTKQLVAADANMRYVPSDFKVSASGSATFVWQPASASGGSVVATSRATATAPWNTPTTLAAPLPPYSIEWLGVAANNQAITTWRGLAGSAQAGFVSIHDPR